MADEYAAWPWDDKARELICSTVYAEGWPGAITAEGLLKMLKAKQKELSLLPDDEWYLVRIPRGHKIYTMNPDAYTVKMESTDGTKEEAREGKL